MNRVKKNEGERNTVGSHFYSGSIFKMNKRENKTFASCFDLVVFKKQ